MYKFKYIPKNKTISELENEYFETIKSKVGIDSINENLLKEILLIKVDDINTKNQDNLIEKFKKQNFPNRNDLNIRLLKYILKKSI